MTKVLAILSGIMLSLIFLLWSMVALVLIGSYHKGQPEAMLTFIVVGGFLLASAIYLIGSFRRLTPPEELGTELLDTERVHTQTPPLTRLQQICAILKVVGGTIPLLFFVGIAIQDPPSFTSYGDTFAFIMPAALVTLFFVVQVSYVYRSWHTIRRYVTRNR